MAYFSPVECVYWRWLGIVNGQDERILTSCANTQSPDLEPTRTPRRTSPETSRRLLPILAS
jgi:hypothetical protein